MDDGLIFTYLTWGRLGRDRMVVRFTTVVTYTCSTTPDFLTVRKSNYPMHSTQY